MISDYSFFIPTRLKIGAGCIREIGDIVSSHGKRCFLVTGPCEAPLDALYNQVTANLRNSKIDVIHFDGVIPNPTSESIDKAMQLAQVCKPDCVLGLGGGSAIDSAKIIALTYSQDKGISWEDIFKRYSSPFTWYPKPAESLPLFAVTTTSGTGSHVTQAAVITDSSKEEKITIFHPGNFPLVSVVDPELMLSLPERGTAATGFDVFAHAFESYLGSRTTPLIQSLSFESIRLVLEYLPKVLKDLHNLEYRQKLAWADTMAGICLANGGADIPHPLSEIIGGVCPRIAHGECLAVVYPEFLRFKRVNSAAPMAALARHLDSKLIYENNIIVAQEFTNRISHFMKQTGLWISLKDHQVTEKEFNKIIQSPILGVLPFASESELKQMIINCHSWLS